MSNISGPNFICIGAQKAGTTWLYSMLEQHPLIHFPGNKEVHFWDHHYNKGIGWYKKLYRNRKNKLVQGDITPAYAILPIKKIQQCYELNPNIKIIYILRNPVERAWSLAMMNFRMIAKNHSFEGKELLSSHFSDDFFLWQAMLKGSLSRGNYARCLENWLKLFDNSQILLVDYEAISSSPREVISDVLKHIGLPGDSDYLNNSEIRKKIFSNQGESMREIFKVKMLQHYMPSIEKLEKLTNTDYSHWK